MKKNNIFMLVMVFCIIFATPALATIDSITVETTPTTVLTTNAVDCQFTVTGTSANYNVKVEWYRDNSLYGGRSQDLDFVANGETTHTTTGDLTAADTSRDEYWFCKVTATDSDETKSAESNSFIITNSEPVITSSPTTQIDYDLLYSYNIVATDADLDTLTYGLVTAPTGMTISGSTVDWTPTSSDLGSNNVEVSVTDGTATKTQSFTLVVNQESKLKITDSDVKCIGESCDDGNLDENGGDVDNVRPGVDIELSIKIENTWARNTDFHDIENIDIEAILEDIGDMNEQDETDSIRRLKPDENDRIILKFTVPDEADEGSYDINVDVTGDDEDGSSYSESIKITLNVEKERYKILINEFRALPSTIGCDNSLQVDVEAKNIGSRDIDDLEIVLRNDALGIFENYLYRDDLRSGDFTDSDTEHRKTFNFQIPENTNAGIYNLVVTMYYDNDNLNEAQTIPITVVECQANNDGSNNNNNGNTDNSGNNNNDNGNTGSGSSGNDNTVVIIDDNLPDGQQVVNPPAVAQPERRSEAFTDSVWFIVILIAAIIILLVFVGLLISLIFK